MDTFLLFLLVGALAQAVDGALGMAYGVISSSVLLALGVPPAMASASVHGAEVFTTAASASSHVWHKNVEWRLFVPLAIAGVITLLGYAPIALGALTVAPGRPGLTWLWLTFAVGFMGLRALTLGLRARGDGWLRLGAAR